MSRRRKRDDPSLYGMAAYENFAAEAIPAGQEDRHTSAEETKGFFNPPGKSRETLLLEDASRTRERLLQIELSAGANASYEDRAGNWEIAQLHRMYGNYCKAVRMNQPLPSNLQKGTKK